MFKYKDFVEAKDKIKYVEEIGIEAITPKDGGAFNWYETVKKHFHDSSDWEKIVNYKYLDDEFIFKYLLHLSFYSEQLFTIQTKISSDFIKKILIEKEHLIYDKSFILIMNNYSLSEDFLKERFLKSPSMRGSICLSQNLSFDFLIENLNIMSNDDINHLKINKNIQQNVKDKFLDFINLTE